MFCLRRKRSRRGATAVEMAVVLGLAFVTLLAVLEYGHYLMVRMLVDNAARVGARMAAVSTNNQDLTPVNNAITQQLAGQVPSPTVQIYWCNASTGANMGTWYNAPYGDGIAVKITTSYSPLVPTFGILPDPMTISATSVMRSEAN
jgi:Flp pilus assembly protein TadG